MGRCMFLRVEIVNKGATSFVIFSEAANVPLPFRLENFSQVGVNGKNPLRLGGVMLTLSVDVTSQYLCQTFHMVVEMVAIYIQVLASEVH